MLKSNQIRAQFPILKRQVNGNSLVYFDNAATTQKPKIVLDTLKKYYEVSNANIHRGVHTLSQEATNKYEASRQKLQQFFNANKSEEIIFTKGTTDSINLVAHGFSHLLQKGDEVIISELEHHSNIVPWQLACEKSGAILRVIPINDKGEIMLEAYDKLLSDKTKIVAVSHISNTLGSINPIKQIIDKAHQYQAAVLIDGAQATAHTIVDVQELDCDFYCASAHKMYGPTGVGVLYGKEAWLQKLPPYQGGGEMIKKVRFEKTTYADLPFKFEAGTPNISGVVAFAAAIDFINEIGLQQIASYEQELLTYATEKVNKIPQLRIIGTSAHKAAVLSFVVQGIHPFDIGSIIDKLGIAVRTGHHCTQPLMLRFDVPGTVRASFALYNTKEEIDIFVEALNKALLILL